MHKSVYSELKIVNQSPIYLKSPPVVFLNYLTPYLSSSEMVLLKITVSFISPSWKHLMWGFPGSSAGKEFACNAGDLGSIPGLGRSLGGGHGTPLQYSCLENSMDTGAWRTTVHEVSKSQTGVSN